MLLQRFKKTGLGTSYCSISRLLAERKHLNQDFYGTCSNNCAIEILIEATRVFFSSSEVFVLNKRRLRWPGLSRIGSPDENYGDGRSASQSVWWFFCHAGKHQSLFGILGKINERYHWHKRTFLLCIVNFIIARDNIWLIYLGTNSRIEIRLL